MKSKFLSLNIKDFLKGLILALLTGLATYFSNNTVQVDFKEIGKACLIVFLSYLTKNLFTNSQDQILKPK
jgi:hypothetical protein